MTTELWIRTALLALSAVLPFTSLWRMLMRNLGMWSRTQNDVDHGKLWSSVVILAVIIAHFDSNPMPLAMALMLVSASFGRSVFTRFLEMKTVTMNTTRSETDITNHTITEKIERVVDADGITVQPTHE